VTEDGVEAHIDLLAEFPYLGPPHKISVPSDDVAQLRRPPRGQAVASRQLGHRHQLGAVFAAGWSACFESAMEFAARNMKITLPADHAVDAEIDLGPEGGRLRPGGSPLREPAGDGARDGAAPCRGGPPGVSLFASNARDIAVETTLV
jgi:hypothetical protein